MRKITKHQLTCKWRRTYGMVHHVPRYDTRGHPMTPALGRIDILVPAFLAVVFVMWGFVDEITGINPRDQVWAALFFGVWAVIRAGRAL